MAEIRTIQQHLATKLDKAGLNILRDILRTVNAYKADKDVDAVQDNVAVFDAAGNPIDSGLAIPLTDLVDLQTAQTLYNKTLILAILTSPYIANFANATHDHTSNAEGGLIEETIDDRVNNLLVAGLNITLTYNDALNTLTIAAQTGLAQFDTVDYTDDHTITEAELGKTVRMNSADDKTFTFPSVNDSHDGYRLNIDNLGAGKLTLQAADSDKIVDSTGGGTYFITGPGSLALEYCHTDVTWKQRPMGIWDKT